MAFRATVFQLAKAGNIEALQEIVQETRTETIYLELEKLIQTEKFNKFLEYLFLAFDCDAEWTVTKKTKVILKCLKLLQQVQIDDAKHRQILNQISDQINGGMLKPQHLIKICNILLEGVEKPNKNDSWQYLIPGILNEISLCDKLEYQDDLMAGNDYNVEVIKKLLEMKWSKDNIVLLAEMFLNVELTPEENRRVISKFMGCIKCLDPDTIPPLMYHLLKLASSSGPQLLLSLQQHYGGIIYDRRSYLGSVYSESYNTDMSNTDRLHNKLIESEGNVFYHISRLVSCKSVQNYLEFLKNSAKLYEIILHPFNFTLLVIIATEHEIPELIDVIKSAMIRYYIEEEMRNRCFFNELISQHCDLSTVIKQAIDNSRNDRDVVITGLVNVSFVLLTSMPQIGSEDAYAKLGRTATFILIRIVESRTDMVKSVITGLKDALYIGRNASLIIDCFAQIATKFKYFMIQNMPLVMEFFNYFNYMSNYEANAFLEVMMNMARHRPSIKEHAMVMLQKSCYANKLESQMNVVTTYLKLLKYLKISSGSSLSQPSQSSQVSISTQISLSRTFNSSQCTFSNEAICKEVIENLQRVFRLQVEAQVHMFKGLTGAVEENPELNTSIWDFLWQAVIELRNTTGVLPPINFENISKLDGSDWLPIRSVSHMVMALAQLFIHLPENEIENYRTDFDSIVSEMINCDVEHFTYDQDIVLTDGSAEAQMQIYVFHEALNTYDAFMTYYILSWSRESENPEQVIRNLFKAHKRLGDYLRQYQKSKKKDTSVSRSSVTISSRSGTGGKKIKLPNSIMPLHCLDKAIELLYSDSVSWAGSADVLKVLVSFHHYILESFINTAQTTKQCKNFPLDAKHYCQKHFESIENNLFTYCVLKQEQLREFDCTTAALTLEAFYQVLVISQYISDKTQETLSQTIFESDETRSMDTQQLKRYIETFQELFNTFDVTDDNDSNRISVVMVNIIALLANQIPKTDRNFANKLIDWMKKICREKTLPSKVAANNFVACLINTSMRFTSSAVVLRLIVSALGSTIGWINGEATAEGTDMAMINDSNSTVVLQTVLNELKNHHDDINWIIKRIKLEYDYFVLINVDASTADHLAVKRKERNTCSKLIEVITLLTNINNLDHKKQPGSLTEKILQTTISIFKLLTTLANYFHSTSTPSNLAFHGANFDGLVRHTMKKLVPAVYQLMQSIEESSEVQHIRSIPNVILGIESLKKAVLQLSIKTKVEVYGNLGIGIVRGFRVKGLEKHVGQQEDDDSIMTEDIEEMSEIVVPTPSADEEETDVNAKAF